MAISKPKRDKQIKSPAKKKAIPAPAPEAKKPLVIKVATSGSIANYFGGKSKMIVDGKEYDFKNIKSASIVIEE